MISLDNDVLVLDRTQGEDDILPIARPAKGGKGGAWYLDLGIDDVAVKNWLLDAEVLDEPVAIRYIARNGQQAEAKAHVEELIPGPEEGDLCRLRGMGAPPPALLADEPKAM